MMNFGIKCKLLAIVNSLHNDPYPRVVHIGVNKFIITFMPYIEVNSFI